MVHTIDTEIAIAAPPDRVWEVFSDFAKWAEWNPFITSIEGDFRVGGKLTSRLEPPGGSAMTFKPTIRVLDAPRELRWLGRLFVPGLFDGEHHFRLEPAGDGTRFIHGEEFRGILVGRLMKRIRASTTAGFEAMNAALKQRVESG